MRPINQRGIAIGPILAVVALLAVVASAIAAGSGSFSGDTSAVNAKAQAAAILETAQNLKFAVDRLLANGCKDTEISFENSVVSGYENPNAPSDKSCHVFNVNGGGLTWPIPPPGASPEPGTMNGKYAFVSNEVGEFYHVYNLGTRDEDLTVVVNINYEVALQMAKILGQSVIVDSGGTHNRGAPPFQPLFTGSYVSGQNGILLSEFSMNGVFCDIGGACTPSAPYYFYQVLIVR